MHVFKLIVIAILLVFASARACLAHDTNMATLDFQKVSSGGYVLHIRTPLVYLDEAVRGDSEAGEALVYGSKPYKLALASYVKKNVSLTANFLDEDGHVFAKPVKFSNTALKLGAHETSIVLQLEGLGDKVFSLALGAPLMTQNPAQENIFRFIDGANIEKVFLDNSNNFYGTIEVTS